MPSYADAYTTDTGRQCFSKSNSDLAIVGQILPWLHASAGEYRLPGLSLTPKSALRAVGTEKTHPTEPVARKYATTTSQSGHTCDLPDVFNRVFVLLKLILAALGEREDDHGRSVQHQKVPGKSLLVTTTRTRRGFE